MTGHSKQVYDAHYAKPFRDNERAAFAALSFMERTGIEPVTSGLQIQFGVRLR
jgi:hypothetical protein